MRSAVLLVMFLLSIITPWRADAQKIRLFAHRGAWSKDSAKTFVIPENSLAAVEQAARLGYEGIEMDVKYTKDKKMVIMHDAKLNRTTRLKDGYRKLPGSVKVSDLTLRELRRHYVLVSSDPLHRERIPTLKEMLRACKKHRLVPMLHSSIYESYQMAQKIMGNGWICFTNNLSMCKAAREISDCLILYSISKGTPEELSVTLREIGGACGVSSMKHGLYTEEFIEKLKADGFQVQASIFPAQKEKDAIGNGVTIVLTDNIRTIK